MPRRRKLALLATFGMTALVVALPDLCYHQWVMGHWLRPESLELRHFGWAFVVKTLVQMVTDLLSTREFLCVVPLIFLGAWLQWRDQRDHFILLGTWVGTVLLVHLPYEALRLRDLLSVFPVLCWWAGYGASGLWQYVPRLSKKVKVLNSSEFLKGFCFALLLAALFLARSSRTLSLAQVSDIDAFGHLNAYQRAGFAQIGQDTDASALIGASLNGGAVELHSRITAFRPAVWQSHEFYMFADQMLVEGQPVYLLQDGLEMEATLAAARERYTLQLVGRYDIPFYHTGGGSTGGWVPLYRLYPSTVPGRAR